MKIGIVGCGFISALYLRTIQRREDLTIVGATDLVKERREIWAKHANCKAYDSLTQMLEQSDAKIIVNLTPPGKHYEVNKAILMADRHVYCEKPLAMDFQQARELVKLAETRNLRISGAPCNVLSEIAQGVWRELRRNAIGTVRLAYAEMDDGMVHLSPFRKWANEFGTPWPAKDEFEVGCTLEHAGYYLTWLAAFFGPADTVTGFGGTTIPDKLQGEPLAVDSPDFTVACIHFRSGVTARLTCSIVAEHDHSMTITGEEGILKVADCWNAQSPAGIQKYFSFRRGRKLMPWKKPIPLPSPPNGKLTRFGAATIDFAAGVAELANAVRRNRPSRLSPEFCLHTTELALAIHNSAKNPGTYAVQTEFEPIEPMPWAW